MKSHALDVAALDLLLDTGIHLRSLSKQIVPVFFSMETNLFTRSRTVYKYIYIYIRVFHILSIFEIELANRFIN